MQLHFKEYGSGEPLVVLHGLFGSLDNWRSFSLKLADSFRILAVDQRNHGRSPHSEEMNYRVMAQDIFQFMDQKQLERAHVLGHSMGGKTAMQLALNHPERLGKLMVVDIAPRAYPPHHAKIFSTMMALDLTTFRTRNQVQEAMAPSIPDLAVRQFLLKNLELAASGGLRWRFGLQEVFSNYHHLCEALVSDLPFAKPCLFIRGEHSDYLSESDLPLIQQLFPKARLEIIPQAGHWVHVDNPDSFTQKVRVFLQAN